MLLINKNTGGNECSSHHSARRVSPRGTRRAESISAAELLLRSSVAAAAPSQQYYNLALNWSSSSRSSSTCGQQHLEEGRGGTSRGDAAARIISSVAKASAPSQQQTQATAVSRDHERSTGLLLASSSNFATGRTGRPDKQTVFVQN